ncbi:hypothetical protein [Treponema sp. OMZ 855]|uniref:hypothetical protein n=1 Tax=Treponema sp. OMZ 855 TaxID=1643512 RepID=UPI0020A4FE9A|nr:hypothetical protein [Treponema sp. OMZ 855]UTC49844.1 hypothetical protein E4N65_06925 [Treponema sp. OMZ 855]
MQTLKTKDITSSSLRHLQGITKDLINYGIWFLYEVDYPSDSNVRYLLSTDKQDILLSEDGSAVGIYPKTADIDYKSIINFDDIPKPSKLNLAESSWMI